MPLIKANGININYEIHGSGRPIVLIGGLGSHLQSWATQIPLYSEHFKVIAFDNRGMGNSDKPDIEYSIEMMADDTMALMDSLNIESASFLGKSMGGMIAQWIGIKYPERVDKLVLGCSTASRDEVGNEIIKIGREIAEKAGMKTVWLTALFLGYSRQYIENNISSIKENLSIIKDSKENLTGYLRQSEACENHDIVDLIPKISAQTLVMYGENDFITPPANSKKLGELIPNSKVISFSAGHGFWRECQQEVDKTVLDFLQN
ncbi:MAG: alpha/beta fold hydrolase [Candidatus Dadabacteria bacterium]|nr:alpha/beta fold hydrolase [Candidatus Dadabacteria bacterium]NIT13549.1 alpha/beta fold hydrolase [Candidatus Dadabacteria bacterium]